MSRRQPVTLSSHISAARPLWTITVHPDGRIEGRFHETALSRPHLYDADMIEGYRREINRCGEAVRDALQQIISGALEDHRTGGK